MYEYSVSCYSRNGRISGQCFALESEARAYYAECVASGRYASVELYDAADNLICDWMADE